MDIVIQPEAVEDIKGLQKEHQEYIKNRLQELGEKPTGHSDVDTIRVRGKQVFKYVMKKDGDRGGKDYRAVYDIQEGEIKVIAVFNRDEGYDKREINDRT